MVEDETARRDHLRAQVPLFNEVLVEEDCPEEQYQCCICKGFCYLAQITCQCTNLVACVDHFDQLCACPATRRTLRKRYSEHQLEEILNAVESRASQPGAWKTRFDHLLEAPRPPLKSMRALLADGERISHPIAEVDDLRAIVVRANAWVEKVSALATRKSTGRRKGRHEDEEVDRSPTAFSDLLKEVEKLAFDSPEIMQLRQMLLAIESFKNEAASILSIPEDDIELDKCKTALILGNSLNIELEEVARLTTIVNRLSWFKKVEEEVDDQTLTYSDVVELLDEAEECGIASDHRTISELQARRARGQKWKEAADKLHQADVITDDDLASLIEGHEFTPVDRDTLRDLINARQTAHNWQTSAQTFLSGVGTANAAQRLCKAVKTATGLVSHIDIPEVNALQEELDFHASWQSQLAAFLVVQPNKVASTLTGMFRSMEARLLPDDDEPNDQFTCFCRNAPGNVMVKCDTCSGIYHPKCVRVLPKLADRQFTCLMCLDPALDDRPSLNALAGFADTTRWNFIIPPAELATLDSMIQLCVRIAGPILNIANPYDEAITINDDMRISHFYRKLFQLPVQFDAYNPNTNERIVFEDWLRKRWNDAKNAGAAVKLERSKRPTVRMRRRARFHFAEQAPDTMSCVCTSPPDDAEVLAKCKLCRQVYHSSCVAGPVDNPVSAVEEMDKDAGEDWKSWKCPCCAVNEGKVYSRKGCVELRVQWEGQCPPSLSNHPP